MEKQPWAMMRSVSSGPSTSQILDEMANKGIEGAEDTTQPQYRERTPFKGTTFPRAGRAMFGANAGTDTLAADVYSNLPANACRRSSDFDTL